MSNPKFQRKHLLWLLALLAMGGGVMMMRSGGGIHPLTATGTIASGQTVSGTITTGTQVDMWTFTNVVGGALQAMVGTDGTAGFEATITINNSAGTQECTNTTGTSPHFYIFCNVTQTGTTTGGTWTVRVKRSIGLGGYKATLSIIPSATSISNGNAGGIMYASTTYSGGISRGDMNIWTTTLLPGAAGLCTATITATGGTGFCPEVWGWGPTGVNFSGAQSCTSTTLNLGGGTALAGTYTLDVFKGALSTTDNAGTYSLSVTGPGCALPTDALADGAYCESCHTGGCYAGDPFNIATGNVYEKYTDYTTVGQNPLAMTRYYNSLSYTRNLYPTLLGANWRTNYDRYLRILNLTRVAAERPDGQVINFRCNIATKSCTADPDMDYTLTYSGSHAATWKLTDPNDTVETYTNTSGKGSLSTIALRNGYTQTMNYTAGALTSVSDSYSRTLSFTYTGSVVTGVTTPDALTLTYGYSTVSSQSLLSTVKYNTSPTSQISYLYENSQLPFALTGITDENGNRYSTWAYDNNGRAISSQLGGVLAANLTQISYASSGNVVTGPLGIVNTYKTTTMLNLPKLTEIDRAANSPIVAATTSIRYDSNGYLNSRTDWNGNNTSWTNNSHGLPTQITFASNTTYSQVSNLTYDLTWPRLPHTISTNGVNGNFTYDSSGNMLTQKLTDTTSQSVPYSTNGQTRTWTYTYNGTGEVLTVQLPRTDVTAKTTYTYTSGTLTSITDALSHVTTITTAQAGGLPKKIKDPNGILTTWAYTTRNWPSSSVITTSAGNLTTSFTYDSAGELTKTTLPDSSSLSYAYDNAHRLTTITNALSETDNLTLDAMGNVTQELWKNASAVTKKKHTATFDALGEMLTSVGGQSQSTAFTYDKNSNVLTITDPLSHITTQTFDSMDRLATSKNAETDLSSIKYDSHSRPLTVTDAKKNATTYVYDGFGDKIQQTSPDSLKTTLWYDADYNVTGKNQSGINYSSATYDALDRLLTRTYSNDSSLNVSLTYDQAAHGFGVGHLTSGTDATGSLSRSYDERGNLTTDARTIASQLYSTGYTFESAGRLSSITYASSGWLVSYSRDSAGQISSVTATQPGHGAVNLATSVTHMPFGPVASLTWGNGVTDARTFDQDYRMTSITDHGTANIQYLSYGYDADNNPTSITDNVTAGNDQTLTYDVIDRLKSAIGTYGTISSITYDSNSNRLTYGATTYTTPGLNDRMSTAAGSAVTYISTGNVNGIGANSMTYNQANQLKTATVSGTTSTYTYDFLGIRNKIKTGTTPFQITQYDQWGNLLTETSAAAPPVETDYAYLDGMPISAIQPAAATISALHTDNLGTVLRGTDSTKTIVYTANFNPNGGVTPTTTITMNLRYRGQHADSTGAYYNIYRYYDPSTMVRYWQVDLLGLGAGMNLYPYANNNLFKYIDPLGLQEIIEGPLGPASELPTGSSPTQVTPTETTPTETAPAPAPTTPLAPRPGEPGGPPLPQDPADLTKQGYQETSHPDAAAAGHRTFRNPDTGTSALLGHRYPTSWTKHERARLVGCLLCL